MGFKMRGFRTILGEMATWIMTNSKTITNFYPGSVTRSLLEAVSIQIEALYFQARKGFLSAIEEAIFNSFAFQRASATRATGDVVVTFIAPLDQRVVFEQGFELNTVPVGGDILYFRVMEDTYVERGASQATLKVECAVTGITGNVPAYAIRRAVLGRSYILDIFNPAKFFNGLPEETTDQRKKRFTDFVEALGRTTIRSIRYGILQIPEVKGVYVKEDTGILTVYAHDINGELPDTLKQKVLDALIEYKSAGVKALVSPVVTKTVDLNMTITVEDGYDKEQYRQILQSSVESYLSYYTVSKDLVRAELIRFVMNIDESAILNVSMDLSQDITTGAHELVRPGNIVVTVQ